MDIVIIGAWAPMFIILIVISQQWALKKALILKMIKKKRGNYMTNELIEKYIGQYCYISTGALGTSLTGKIVEVKENWIKVETKKGDEIVNLDFIQIIKPKN